jgi:hypothetical protein
LPMTRAEENILSLIVAVPSVLESGAIDVLSTTFDLLQAIS